MQTKTFYYARVSSNSQNLARQIEAFKADGADDCNIITEKHLNLSRPALDCRLWSHRFMIKYDITQKRQ
jgi:predicted site-specific integrase-resolvase